MKCVCVLLGEMIEFGFTNPVGTGGVCDMCLGCGGVGGSGWMASVL